MLARILGWFMNTTSTSVIEHEELLHGHQGEKYTLVDVREPHEYAGGRIPGAINLPLSKFDPARVPKGRQVVLICQAGTRSAAALKKMKVAGVEDARHYAAGMSGWRSRKGPVVV
jgi:rhodanese-related sulfurtransferase